MENVSALVQPYDELSDIVSETKSALGSCERLVIILKRIQASDHLFEKLLASKQLFQETWFLENLRTLLDVYPVEVTHGWQPSEEFLENFWNGNVDFDSDDNIIGGPFSKKNCPVEKNLSPSSKNETLTFPNAVIEKHLTAEFDPEENLSSFARSLEGYRVQKSIFEHYRRTWLLDDSIPVFISKTAFWEVVGKNDEISEIYEENPLRTVSDYFSHFVNGDLVETSSSNSPIPEDCKEILAKIINVIFDRLDADRSNEYRLLKTYKKVIIGEEDCKIFAAIAGQYLLSEDGRTETDFGELLVKSLPVVVPNWAIEFFFQCIPNIINYLDRLADNYICSLNLNEHEDNSQIADIDAQESFITGFLILLSKHVLSQITSRHKVDTSKLCINSLEFLSRNCLNVGPDSASFFKKIENTSTLEETARITDLLSEYFNLHEDVEHQRLRQISRLIEGKYWDPISQPTLNLKCCGYSYEEDAIKLKSFENFEVENAISASMAILKNSLQDRDKFLDLVLQFNELQMPKIAAALLITSLEHYEKDSIECDGAEGAEFWEYFNLKICRKLFLVYSELPGLYRPDLNLAFSRLFSKLGIDAQKRLLSFFPISILKLDIELKIEPKKLLKQYLGTVSFEKLEEQVVNELILAEKHFRELTLINYRKEQISIPAAIVHWSRAIEAILKKIILPLVETISIIEVSDQSRGVIQKVQSGHASMGEMVNLLLEFKKKIKGIHNQSEILARFQNSCKLVSLVQNSEHREQLRMLSKLRNLASHDSQITKADVLTFKYSLISTGLLRNLSDIYAETL